MTLGDGLTIVAIVVPVMSGLAALPLRVMWGELQLSRKRFHDVNQVLTAIAVNVEVIASHLEIKLPANMTHGGRDGE